MRLIFPLDFCNAFLYESVMGLSIMVRQLKLNGFVSQQRYQFLIELTTAVRDILHASVRTGIGR